MKYTNAKIIEALRRHDGNVAAAARDIGCSRSTIDQRARKDKELADVLADLRETMIDEVESALYREAKKGEGWAVCFFLKTQGRHRGYNERHEVVQVTKAPDIDYSKLSDRELEQLERLLSKASKSGEVPA